MTPLQETITSLCIRHLGRPPTLDNPTSHNDKIQWLKLYDQRPEQVVMCDKLQARLMVPAYAQIPIVTRAPCVVKCNHDSGSAVVCHTATERAASTSRLRHRLRRPYGIDKGEWAYSHITPAIYSEHYAPFADTDYKFHCVDGRVKWVQVIWNRASGKPNEAVLLPDRSPARHGMDEKMKPAAREVDTEAWRQMIDLAESLSAGWKYVRIDLYHDGEQPWFGEFTFWPRAGCYKFADPRADKYFGGMMGFDTTTRREPIQE